MRRAEDDEGRRGGISMKRARRGTRLRGGGRGPLNLAPTDTGAPVPVNIPRDLPARATLGRRTFSSCPTSRPPPRTSGRCPVVNLMPTKIATETHLLRLLGNTPIQLEITLLHMGSHASQNTHRGTSTPSMRPSTGPRRHLRRAGHHRGAGRELPFGASTTGTSCAGARLEPRPRLLDHARVLGRAGRALPPLRRPRAQAARRCSASSTTRSTTRATGCSPASTSLPGAPHSRHTTVEAEDVDMSRTRGPRHLAGGGESTPPRRPTGVGSSSPATPSTTRTPSTWSTSATATAASTPPPPLHYYVNDDPRRRRGDVALARPPALLELAQLLRLPGHAVRPGPPSPLASPRRRLR